MGIFTSRALDGLTIIRRRNLLAIKGSGRFAKAIMTGTEAMRRVGTAIEDYVLRPLLHLQNYMVDAQPGEFVVGMGGGSMSGITIGDDKDKNIQQIREDMRFFLESTALREVREYIDRLPKGSNCREYTFETPSAQRIFRILYIVSKTRNDRSFFKNNTPSYFWQIVESKIFDGKYQPFTGKVLEQVKPVIEEMDRGFIKEAFDMAEFAEYENPSRAFNMKLAIALRILS